MKTLTFDKSTLLVGGEPPSEYHIKRTVAAAQRVIEGGKQPCKDCGVILPNDGTAIVCADCAKRGSN
jgi:hypothetical protein